MMPSLRLVAEPAHFLLPYMKYQKLRVSGVDVAPSLISLARRAVPEGRFEVADAAENPVPSSISAGVESSDVTVVNGVLAYLPDIAVVERLIGVLRKAPGRVALLDVPDARLRTQRESARRSLLPPGEYESRYAGAGLRHLYIDPEWLTDEAGKAGLIVDIVPQNIAGFGQSAFHFNAFLSRSRAA